jgi:aerobic-type carbon monoxide dehydrogenase small subunit (CoxS/CutS family)
VELEWADAESAAIPQRIMETKITLKVNGQPHAITTDPQRSLLDVLREELHLTGTKYGCGEGQCRACTVLADGKSIASCTTAISEVENQSITTIEGLAHGDELHPVQKAFLEEEAFQCGYCTAGMIMEAVDLLRDDPHLATTDVPARMQRHICRCGTYPKILKAIRRAAV